MFAIGLFLFTLRNQAPVVLTEIVSNLFLLPGLMLFNFGNVKVVGLNFAITQFFAPMGTVLRINAASSLSASLPAMPPPAVRLLRSRVGLADPGSTAALPC